MNTNKQNGDDLMTVTLSYLYENGYIENVIIGEFEDGTPFVIFESWDDVYEVIYAVIEKIVPEALELYEQAGLVKERRWGHGKILEDVRIDNEVPKIVKNALDEHGIKWYNIVESALGCEWGFSDEYTTCDDCGNIIRTSPDSYHWQPDFYIGDGFIVCNRCFNDSEDYQEEYLADKINNPKQAVNGLMTEEQIEELGFKKLNSEYEYGWYNVNHDPEKIYEALSKDFEEILFYVNNVEQFRVNFIVFVRGEIE